MKASETTASSALGQVEPKLTGRRIAEPGSLRCLIASTSRTRRNLLANAARSANWEVMTGVSAMDALNVFQCNAVQLAMVDLDDRGATADGMRAFVEMLSSTASDLLVAVCGHEADAAEEIWCRQAGVWLYLPGITNSSEVSLVCEQATLVVEDRDRKERKASV